MLFSVMGVRRRQAETEREIKGFWRKKEEERKGPKAREKCSSGQARSTIAWMGIKALGKSSG